MARRTTLELLTVGAYLVTGAGGGDFIRLGVSPSDEGLVGLPNNEPIWWRNKDNDGNVQGISVDNFNELILAPSGGGVSVIVSDALHYFTNDVQWPAEAVTPTLEQDDDPTSGVVADAMSFKPQSATHATLGTGGNYETFTGDGPTAKGKWRAYVGKSSPTLRIEFDSNGVGFNGQTPTIPNITGALSLVADANAKAVLTSLVAALKNAAGGVGIATDGTT